MSRRGARKRKRLSVEANFAAQTGKRLCVEKPKDSQEIRHSVLSQYYPHVQTLRQYLVHKLPASSRIRKRKLLAVGQTPNDGHKRDASSKELSLAVAGLLDTTLVGHSEDCAPEKFQSRWKEYASFSQKHDDSTVTLQDGLAGAICSQSEIVDFVIWKAFSKEAQTGLKPRNLLCDGFRRDMGQGRQDAGSVLADHGIFVRHPNECVATLKTSPWPQILSLLGKSGEKIMIDLLMDCGIFVAVKIGQQNYHQIVGTPIFELDTFASDARSCTKSKHGEVGESPERRLTEIVFVRSRILYARPALNGRGMVQFGLRHIHALNRLPAYKCDSATEPGTDTSTSTKGDLTSERLLMYIFPRQFGLHNVFTSTVDRTKTAQKFQDYTLREEGIYQKYGKVGDSSQTQPVRMPKRLRGEAQRLVRRLQVLHGRCSYSQMMEHYCPVDCQKANANETAASVVSGPAIREERVNRWKPRSKRAAVCQPPAYESLTDLATPHTCVSAFCQAVIAKIMPHGFLGSGCTGKHNLRLILKQVDHFVRLRRFENMSLHEALQDLQLTGIAWLAPPVLQSSKISLTDFAKRKEIFHEFVYYLFDSILMPLIRSNFYVTESSVHRYHLLYFRHDVWRSVAEPAIAALKTKMFEEVKLQDALNTLNGRKLGFGQMRLLPKVTSMRPITNLRCRTMKPGKGGKTLGWSINTILGPVYSILKYEKQANAGLLGSTMFSIGDMYERIKIFRDRIASTSSGQSRFYLAKVDVQAAFDTIPQRAVVDLMKTVLSKEEYELIKHVEVRSARSSVANADVSTDSTTKRWQTLAHPAYSEDTFAGILEQSMVTTKKRKKSTVFVDGVARTTQNNVAVSALLSTHVQQHLVKIGKKYYRQKAGIPQGSVLAATLCNYFYADLEKKHLPFSQSGDCLLLRLIDDFLLITTDKGKAAKFVRILQQGLPDYGVTVSPAKTLVNFDMPATAGASVPRLAPGARFPYCGSLIDTSTLELIKDCGIASTALTHKPSITTAGAPTKDPILLNSLTISFSSHPGTTFTRKILHFFRIQSHLMFFDTRHNNLHTVHTNIHNAFLETAAKTWAYLRCLPGDKQPCAKIVCETIRQLLDVAYGLLTSRSRSERYIGYECKVSRGVVSVLGLSAFRRVLGRKQARFKEVLTWLDAELGKLVGKDKGLQRLAEARASWKCRRQSAEE